MKDRTISIVIVIILIILIGNFLLVYPIIAEGSKATKSLNIDKITYINLTIN